MCTTPAPPSTLRVASSIWSGTGEVKISPAQAASSMPGPTNPPCRGSCPEPPPEMRPTLPCTGESARYTMRWVWSTRSSGWAMAMPRNASATTSAGSLMSFFMSVGLSGCGRGRGGFGYGGRCRGGIGAGAGDGDVGQRGEHACRQLGGQVHRQLTPLHRAAGELLDQHRPKRAGGVDRRTGGGCHREDRREHHQADRHSGEPCRGLAVYHAEHGEHEYEGTHELGEKGLRYAGMGRIRGHPQAGVTGRDAEYAEDRPGTDDGAHHLRRDVSGHPRPGELARDGQSERDRGVDVVAADVSQRVDGRDDDGRERE